MRDVRRTAVVVAVLVVAAIAFAKPAGAAGSVSVTPSTGLVEGDEVTVTVAGLRPNVQIAVAQCPTGTQPSVNTCGNVSLQSTDANGAATIAYVVHRFPKRFSGGTAFDCGAPAACDIGAAETSDITGTAVGMSVSFLAAPPPVAGTLAVTPSTPRPGDFLTVTGAGWALNAAVTVAQCVTGSDDCVSTTHVAPSRGGEFSVDVRSGRTINTATGPVDCAAAPGLCAAVAFDERDAAGTRAEVPLDFGNAPLPTVTVDPAVDLVDGQVVAVRGTGWPPGTLGISQCPAAGGTPPCGGFVLANAQSDGSFATTLHVHAHIGDTDCRAAPATCLVYVTDVNLSSVAAPLDFAPAPPPGDPVRGTVSVTPTVVASGNEFEVSAEGWAVETSVRVGVCPSATTDPLVCTAPVATFETGSFFRFLTAPENATGPAGPVDCTAAAGACVLLVTDTRDDAGTRVEVPLTIVGPRAGHVDPASGIGAQPGGTLVVRADGWAPNVVLQVEQCVTARPSDCALATAGGTNADGSLRAVTPITGTLGGTDCTAADGLCSLRVSDIRDPAATAVLVPLVFVPSAPVPVTSHYTADENAVLAEGASLAGLSPELMQREGARTTAWIFHFALASAEDAPHVGLDGTVDHTTLYQPDEYIRYLRYATRWGYTLEEFQKFGALFFSYLNMLVHSSA